MSRIPLKKYIKSFKPGGEFWKHKSSIKEFLRKSYSLVLLLTLISVGTYLFPRDKSSQYSEFQLGSIARESIVAPETFPINKTDEEINSEKETAKNSISARFYRDVDAEDHAQTNINLFFDELKEFLKLENSAIQLINTSRVQSGTVDSASSEILNSIRSQAEAIGNSFKQKYNIDVGSQSWAFFRDLDDDSFENFRTNCIQVLKNIHTIGLTNVRKSNPDYNDIDLLLYEEQTEAFRNINDFIDQDETISIISGRLQNYYPDENSLVSVGLEIIQNFFVPNIKYNIEETNALRDEAESRVPLTRGFVREDEVIIDAHERVTDIHFRKIQSLRGYLSEQSGLQGPFSIIIHFAGQAGFLSLTFLIFILYLYQFRPALLKNNKQITMLFLIFMTQLIFFFLINRQLGLSEYLIPTVIGSMLLAIIFDGNVGFFGTIIIALLAGGYMGNDFGITLYALAGGAVGVISMKKIRNRSQFFKAILYLMATYAVVIFVTGWMRLMQVQDISLMVLKFGIPNAVFSPLMTLGFVAFFEIVFGVSTDMTLLELSDLNRPLLKELSMSAPGTYHHSIVLGNLSESAAEAIGANSLLARVGCYYHDIGKMVKPEYFMENQPDSMKKHEALAPSMSSLIISSHVREGIEIADKYKLPEEIKDFISQHHGTGKISFFYEKAKEKSGDKYLNPSDYCYPGPKPQTKEVGIVMLSDSVEAATRALKDPSPSRITERVNSVIEQRFREGQLNACELTLKDLSAISASFVKILIGMFHVRVEYPDNDKKNTAGNLITREDN